MTERKTAMTDNSKTQISTYNAAGNGIIDFGYHENSAVIVELIDGNALVTIGTDTVEASLGDFIYIPQDVVFRVESRDGMAAMRALVFNMDIIKDNMENFESEILYMFYVQSRTKMLVFKKGHPIYERLAYSMHEAYEEYVSKDVCFRLPVKANVYLAMAEILRFYCGSRNETDQMIYHNVLRLRPVIDYIAEYYREKIYVETLSDMITVSPDYFTKMFKDSIGKTPIDYINAMRINDSLRLLSFTDTPVNEIAEQLGFSNTNYFHKIFKAYMDTSPLAYRKSTKK